MTGIDVIKYLHAGYTLRRKEWESDQKCKAYFSDDGNADEWKQNHMSGADLFMEVLCGS